MYSNIVETWKLKRISLIEGHTKSDKNKKKSKILQLQEIRKTENRMRDNLTETFKIMELWPTSFLYSCSNWKFTVKTNLRNDGIYQNFLHISLGSVICGCREITENWILQIRNTDFRKQMSAYKFQEFISISINSTSLLKMFYDTNEMNTTLKVIKYIFNLHGIIFLFLPTLPHATQGQFLSRV